MVAQSSDTEPQPLDWDDERKRLRVGWFQDGREAWYNIVPSMVTAEEGSSIQKGAKTRSCFFPGVVENVPVKELDLDKVPEQLTVTEFPKEKPEQVSQRVWTARYGEWLEQELEAKKRELEKKLGEEQEKKEDRESKERLIDDTTLAEDNEAFFARRRDLRYRLKKEHHARKLLVSKIEATLGPLILG
ncbi:hypothetical protein P171DRAFT_481444 [Karstenula rhodostoma CBS 690.94]|uniref:Uncharacterized protein n=1 Tax=Karstenula rhodostoma CBS 690.94 TaxID=1392251 RepID=A0A9P4UFT0_9PLEO|nr:hypothetical protein P171DRAFT_481444 [Karstenula rhodostoma CBS 690.94]